MDAILGLFREGFVNEHRAETLRRSLVGRPLTEEMLKDVIMMALGPPSGPPPEQPPWMNKPEYERLVQEHGVHWFLVTIPTDALRTEIIAENLIALSAKGASDAPPEQNFPPEDTQIPSETPTKSKPISSTSSNTKSPANDSKTSDIDEGEIKLEDIPF